MVVQLLSSGLWRYLDLQAFLEKLPGHLLRPSLLTLACSRWRVERRLEPMLGRLGYRRRHYGGQSGAVVYLDERAANGVPGPVRGLSLFLERIDVVRRGQVGHTSALVAA